MLIQQLMNLDSLLLQMKNENSPLRDEIKAYVTTLFPEDSLDINSDSKTVVLFPTNKTDYYEIFQQDLDDLILALKNKPAKAIKVIGYADLRGYDDENLTLSKNRAKTVINFLVNNGINSEIISYDFRGATTKFDDIVLMSNRRVEIFLERKFINLLEILNIKPFKHEKNN